MTFCRTLPLVETGVCHRYRIGLDFPCRSVGAVLRFRQGKSALVFHTLSGTQTGIVARAFYVCVVAQLADKLEIRGRSYEFPQLVVCRVCRRQCRVAVCPVVDNGVAAVGEYKEIPVFLFVIGKLRSDRLRQHEVQPVVGISRIVFAKIDSNRSPSPLVHAQG